MITLPRLKRSSQSRPIFNAELASSPATSTITITVESPPTYKPTKAELAAIRKGEAEAARGEYVTLADILHDLDPNCRKSAKGAARAPSTNPGTDRAALPLCASSLKSGAKTARKVSR